MNSNVITQDAELITQSDGLYGDARVDYLAFVIGMCGDTVVYESGGLDEVDHKQVSWTLSQKFPHDQFLAALKSTQTELPQVHAKPNKFSYTQYAYGIEFIYKKSKGFSTVNVKAQTVKEMLKEWDLLAWTGDEGINTGIKDNPNAETSAQVWDGTFATLKAAVGKIISNIRKATEITSSDYSNIQIGYDSNVYEVINQTDTMNVSNLERLQKSYPDVVFVEIPPNLEKKADGEGFLSGAYRPMVRLHRGALPSIDAVDQGKYGKSEDTLFGADSAAVEVEVQGALQLMELTKTKAAAEKINKK